jgi:siderophore synthetase component
MQLEDGTILENVSSDDIMITQAVLEGSHGSHPAKKKKKK